MFSSDEYKEFEKFLNPRVINSSNTIFWLHNNVTVVVLMVMAVIVNLNNYVGDPITCVGNDDKKIKMFDADQYCWIYGTTSGVTYHIRYNETLKEMKF